MKGVTLPNSRQISEPQHARPIIILGAARSGTKFLRDTLGASSRAAVVPYDVNFIWRTGNESSPSDALNPASCTEELARAISTRLYFAAGIRGEGDFRRLIEKTVSNTVRVPFVARVFPHADIVHIVRDGRDVVESSLRQWNAPTDWRYLLRKMRSFPVANYRYALWYLSNRLRGLGRVQHRAAQWGVRYPGIEADLSHRSVAEICARQWVECVEQVRAESPRLNRFRELSYEDLVAGPQALSDLVEWLELPERDVIIENFHTSVMPDPQRPWDRDLAPPDAEAVLQIITPSLRNYGYV